MGGALLFFFLSVWFLLWLSNQVSACSYGMDHLYQSSQLPIASLGGENVLRRVAGGGGWWLVVVVGKGGVQQTAREVEAARRAHLFPRNWRRWWKTLITSLILRGASSILDARLIQAMATICKRPRGPKTRLRRRGSGAAWGAGFEPRGSRVPPKAPAWPKAAPAPPLTSKLCLTKDLE